jgi:hypothetical protein
MSMPEYRVKVNYYVVDRPIMNVIKGMSIYNYIYYRSRNMYMKRGGEIPRSQGLFREPLSLDDVHFPALRIWELGSSSALCAAQSSDLIAYHYRIL